MTAARGIAANFAILSAGQALARFLSFLVTVHLARVLLAEGFGALGLAVGALAYATLVVELGFDLLGPLEVARGRVPLPILVGNVITLRLLLSLLAITLVCAFAGLAPVPAAARPLLLLYSISLAADAVDLNWVFLGSETMAPVAASEILQQVVLAAGVFGFVWRPADILTVPLLYVAGRSVAVVGLLFAFIRGHGWFALGLDRELIRPLVRAALPLWGSRWAGALLHNFDLLLLGLITGVEAAGLYNAAYRILWVPTLLALAYLTALRPVLARGFASGGQALQPLLRRAGSLSLSFGVGAAIGGGWLAAPLLDWLYGPGYGGAAWALRVLLASFAFFPLSRLCRNVAWVGGRGGADLLVVAVAAAINVALNLILVPRGGVLGAACATFVAEALILGLAARVARSVAGRLPFLESPWRILTAALVLIGWLWLSEPLHVLARIVLGAACYVMTLVALGVVGPADLLSTPAPPGDPTDVSSLVG